MRSRLLSSVLVVAAVAVACSDSSSTPGGAATPPGTPRATSPTTPPGETPPSADAGVDAGPLVKETEREPNNGATATELNPMTVPGEMDGKIEPANDIDLFGVTLTPGELWEWTITPSSADLAPHVTVFDTKAGTLNPTLLLAGTAGAAASLDHFVLRTGAFVAAVRDARNVPTPSGKGGPAYGYSLVARKKAINAVSVTFPATKSGRLASLSTIDLFTFVGTGGKGFDIKVKAARKLAPSTLDSRLSLYDVTTKTTFITNDDVAGTSDSEIGSASASSDTFVVVLENEGVDAADLSYDIEFTLRP